MTVLNVVMKKCFSISSTTRFIIKLSQMEKVIWQKLTLLLKSMLPQEKKFSREENLKYLAVFPEIAKLNSRKI